MPKETKKPPEGGHISEQFKIRFSILTEEAMINKPTPFFDAAKAYPEFKGIFNRFCDTAMKKFNGNEHLPNVDISAKPDGASATLKALDRNFDISLRFIIVNDTPWGIIEASLSEETKEPVRLCHYFFDARANVKATLVSAFGSYSLYDTEFVIAFFDQITEKYFFYLSGALKLTEATR